MRHLAGPLALGALTWVLVTGCNPDVVVLMARHDGGADAGCVAPGACDLPLGAPCAADGECANGLVCEARVCAACTVAVSRCDVKCVPTEVPVASDRNGCAVCTCAPPPECSIDGDCRLAQRCLSGKCFACALVDDGCTAPCPPGQKRFPTKRNACAVCECARPDECRGDADCGGTGMTCFAGANCDDGCDGSPACCHGNVCAPSSCSAPTKVPCSFLGCPSGLRCHTTCSLMGCQCDSKASPQWACTPDCSGDVCSTDP